jgi:hypothetical protein
VENTEIKNTGRAHAGGKDEKQEETAKFAMLTRFKPYKRI